ncbi:hypothetical protein OXX69_000377 [Metschnikowia pulcherrima]
MGYDVQIEIDRSRTGGTFTNHDIISGVVKLTTTSALTLAYIQVKLEGVAETQLVIPAGERQDMYGNGRRNRRNDKRDRKDKFRQDTHKILYDSTIVFPPENVRSVSQAKDFTLTPGTYTYGFQFKIPLFNSCKKLTGISNKIQFSKNSYDLVINNGNFNGRTLINSANNYISGISNPGRSAAGQAQSQEYHIDAQLPPTLQDMKGMASIKYFVKATCKRSSFLKANLRAFDPFVFLPLDLNSQYSPYREGQQFEEYRERFYRKDLVFKDRLPEVVGVKVPPSTKALPTTPETKSSKFFGSFFGTSSPQYSSSIRSGGSSSSGVAVKSRDVAFAFEMRMPYPPSLSPTTAPTFKLYFVSEVDPAAYSLANYGKPEHSNGLGIIYLQSLKFELRSVTIISVLDNDGLTSQIHQSRVEETLPLCSNTYQNLQFDLRKCKRQKSSSATSSAYVSNAYELEIPSKYYENFRLPRNLPPTFQTCNIARGYGLYVVAGVSSEKMSEAGSAREANEKVKYIDIFCPDIQILSGLKLTSNLHSNASGTSLGKAPDSRNGSLSSGYPPDHKPPLAEKHSQHSVPYANEKQSQNLGSSNGAVPDGPVDGSIPLPTYDDVVRESSYQDDSEHQRARYRYGA